MRPLSGVPMEQIWLQRWQNLQSPKNAIPASDSLVTSGPSPGLALRPAAGPTRSKPIGGIAVFRCRDSRHTTNYRPYRLLFPCSALTRPAFRSLGSNGLPLHSCGYNGHCSSISARCRSEERPVPDPEDRLRNCLVPFLLLLVLVVSTRSCAPNRLVLSPWSKPPAYSIREPGMCSRRPPFWSKATRSSRSDRPRK